MSSLQLYGTPLSHFTRKVRVLLAEWNVAYDFVRAPAVLGTRESDFGHNPLLRVPALRAGEDEVFESDAIARYLVRRFDPSDRFGVLSELPTSMNRLNVANGLMAHEATLLLVRRSGFEAPESIGYLRKLREVLASGLQWLESQSQAPDAPMDYADIALVCLWQHLVHWKFVEAGSCYPRIAARVAALAERPSLAGTTPQASLEEALAAGWRPG